MAVLKTIVVASSMIFMFTACSIQKGANNTAAGSSNTLSQSSTPSETVKDYYSSEIPKSAKYLSDFFLNPSKSQASAVKRQLSAFNVDKIEFAKIFDQKKHGKYVVMLCAYNTYFKGIKKKRPDIEIVTLINKENKWYFLNDYSSVSSSDVKWINSSNADLKDEISTNSSIQSLIKETTAFDNENSAFMNNAMESVPVSSKAND